MSKKIKITRPKGIREDETVEEWYKRVTLLGNPEPQGIGSLNDQSTAVINGDTRESDE